MRIMRIMFSFFSVISGNLDLIFSVFKCLMLLHTDAIQMKYTIHINVVLFSNNEVCYYKFCIC